MMHNELPEGSELYIKRTDAHKISIKEMNEHFEYYPCENNEGTCIVINDFKYSITKNQEKLEICVIEDVSPKYWEKEYSADLWFKSYVKAVENNKKCVKIFKDVDPHQLMSLLFYFDFNAADFQHLGEVIDNADSVLREIEAAAEVLVKRSLIKYFNK